jgi:hypothetical protein
MLIVYLSFVFFIAGWLLRKDGEKQKAKVLLIIGGIIFIIGLGVCSTTF